MSRMRGRLRLVESDPDTAARDLEPESSPGSSPTSSRRAASPDRTAGRGLAELDDAQLVALARNRDIHALETLYRRHVSFALHLAARIEGSTRDIEDVVHDAFVHAFEKLGDLADPAAFRGWLGAIVVHAVRSRIRRARLMSMLGLGCAEAADLDAIASDRASPVVRAQLAQIYALVQTLPVDDRIAWTLRAIEGHDLEAVARLTRCSLATVKRRIARAQHFLDAHFVDSQKESAS
jgi:RNA polymerase sigma-70 factor (ECF subfamily)